MKNTAFFVVIIIILYTQFPLYSFYYENKLPYSYSYKFKEIGKVLSNQFNEQNRENYLKTQASPKTDNIGDAKEFWTQDFSDSSVKWEKVAATCKKSGDHCYIYTDNSIDHNDNFNNIIDTIYKEYENTMFAKMGQEFGVLYPGINNDEKLTIFILNIKDSWNGNDVKDYVSSYFSPYDQFLASSYEHSNERNMIYIDYDPLITSNFSVDQKEIFSTIASELTRLINYQADPNETTWLSEACALYAEFFCYKIPENSLRAFLNSNGDTITNWQGSEIDRGSSFLFIEYIKEKYGENNTYFMYDLIHDRSTSLNSIMNRLPLNSDTDEVITNFNVANYIGTKHSIDKDGMFYYKNIDINKYKNIEFFKKYEQSTNLTADVITDDIMENSDKNKCPMYMTYYYNYPVNKSSITISEESASYINFRTPFWPDSTFYFKTPDHNTKLYAIGYDSNYQLIYNDFIPISWEGSTTFTLENINVKKLTIIPIFTGTKTGSSSSISCEYSVSQNGLKLTAFSNPILRNQVTVALETELNITKSVMEYDNETKEITLTNIRNNIYTSTFYADDIGRYKIRVNVEDSNGMTISSAYYFNVQDINFFREYSPSKYSVKPNGDKNERIFLFEDKKYYAKNIQSFLGVRIEGINNNNYNINFNITDYFGTNNSKSLSIYKKDNNNWKFIKSNINNNIISSTINSDGSYAVLKDNLSPVFEKDFNDIIVKDNLSGIGKITVNNLENNVKYNVIRNENETIIQVNSNSPYKIEVLDNCGNKAEYVSQKSVQNNISTFSEVYPNPTDNELTIRTKLTDPHNYKIKIYDNSNEIINTIYDFYEENGYTISDYDLYSKNGHKLSNGIYYYRIFADNEKISTGKFTVLR